MSEFHQMQFGVLIIAFLVARLQGMKSEMEYEIIGDYDEYITGWDNRKTLIETPKNFVKLNLIGYALNYGIQALIYFLDYLGEI